jgi:urea carboxylase
VTPKYNPARTFTWEGTVGLGGAYLCIYPMNSPGGYQLMGRTLPIWNTFGAVEPFAPVKPWLLDIFDQIRFHEVGEGELDALRKRCAAACPLCLDCWPLPRAGSWCA